MDVLGFLGSLVSPITKLIDDLHTSDTEKAEAKAKVLALLTEADKSLDQEVTARHKNDMMSDSWLSKNIRPLTLSFTTVSTFILVYLTIFLLPLEKVALLEAWMYLLASILTTQIIFYFGSRGLEKKAQINVNKKG